MGFLSYNLKYFSDEIARIEAASPDRQTIYHAKQLLKMLDDLKDENYTQLGDLLEESYHGVSRLKRYIIDNNAMPFPLLGEKSINKTAEYKSEEVELNSAILKAVESAKNSSVESDNPFLESLVRFCEWIGYNEDAAYVFLLRDTLLPYIYYLCKGRSNIYAWLLSRKALSWIANESDIDDRLRAEIFTALECGKGGNFSEFCGYVLPAMRRVIGRYSTALEWLQKLLRSITAKKIIVVESGCSGTFPLLLKSLDERVDVRMYSTYPYLLSGYGERVFTPCYENIRLFETLLSQDEFMQFSSIKGDSFYVRTCSTAEIKKQSLGEINAFIKRFNKE